MKYLNKSKWGIFTGSVVCVALSILTGCNNESSSNKNVADKPKTEKTANNNATDQGNITMPVLNALFFEEGFEKELKSKLELTDAEIQSLKDTANNSMAGLDEDNPNYTSSREAAKATRQQVTTILGQEKADRFFKFIEDRYVNSDETLPIQPNSIPTDTRIVVNAPAFRMDVFQSGKLVKTYLVGIGYPEFPLPSGLRKADNIIFNPTWTPPDEPWVKGKVSAGKKVAAGSKLNPLGPIKVPIGLPSLIHGGKQVSKLGNYASHGCVGLTNAQVQDFAGMLTQIGGTPLSTDSILSFEKSKTKTKTLKLAHPVMVELRYETIVAENGNLHIYRDVYEHGTNTPENANRVLEVYGVNYKSLSDEEKNNLNSALTEMNLDAKGNAIAVNSSDTLSEDKNDDSANDKKKRAAKGKVTRAVVGRKEILVPIAALKGKGYPAPVNYDIGKTTAAK